jgi:hypothetical protein
MIVGVEINLKYKSLAKIFISNLFFLKTQKPTQNKIKFFYFKTKSSNTKFRPKWNNENHLTLYYDYFFIFSMETIHTFSYLADYLETIYVQTLYEEAYWDFYEPIIKGTTRLSSSCISRSC